ncbi:hypothetical protein CONPUDRAFT_85993 [Coniophora puteana RWD-64-598 SS2]|uniref:Dynamin N-terminal domain-containing protein n=1 Tax=Coniophora puteana (strain RWD-64-598) TaxID=741705 RepID=R7SEL9_CONPW|nr:uncharacterized protein CONPUDRAFT_85993 [Coniophora puteana RWD-64-598 SS2]EIW74300.1 hypothetical protein CONPUDRAFT_85993 [Coniophora puteana RWD-64-598 SS2]
MVNIKNEELMAELTQEYLTPKAEPESDPEDFASSSEDEDTVYASADEEALEKLRQDLEAAKELVSRRHGGGEWEKELQTLLQRVDDSPSTRTVVVVGHAGHGKTTLLNSMLHCSVLTTASSVRACTSAVVEVHYEDTAEYRAEVGFLSEDAWYTFIEPLVEDVLEGCTRLPSINEYQAGAGAEDPAHTLVQLFPHLSGQKVTSDISVESLSNHPSVKEFVGTTRDFTADTPEKLEAELRTYLSTRQDDKQSRLWYIVEVAKVFGPFEMLSTGTVLIDLPGYGDSNTFRGTKAEEFLRRADTIVLVSDIRRVADDANTYRYLKKSIERFVGFDGRTVGEDALIMVVTGSDNQVSEAEFDFQSEKQKEFVHDINEKIKPVSDKITNAKAIVAQITSSANPKSTGKGSKNKKTKPVAEPPKLDETKVQQLNQMTALIDGLNNTQDNLRRQKYIYLALRRNDQVIRYVQTLYKNTYREIDKGLTAIIPPISVHVVGSVDYRRLERGGPMEEPTMVFDNVDDTGIPALQKRIRNVALRGRSHNLISTITSFDALASEISQFYRTQIFRDMKYAAKAKQVLEELQESNQIAQTERVDRIGELIDSVMTSIEKAAESSASESHEVIRDLGSTRRFNTYKAIMRRHGEWKDTDLNDDLSEEMGNEDVLSKWHGMLNVELITQLDTLNKDLITQVGDALDEIVDEAVYSSSSAREDRDGTPLPKRLRQDVAQHGTLASCIQQARASIKYRESLGNAHQSAVASVKAIQRSYGGSFRELVKQELAPQYDLVASESGAGMFARMKARLEGYFKENNEKFFKSVLERIREPLSTIQGLVDSTYKDELDKVYRVIRNTMLVEQRPLKEAEKADITKYLTLLKRARGTAADFADQLRSDVEKADREIEDAAPVNHDD